MGAGCRERIGPAARATLERMPNAEPGVSGWAWVWLHTLERDYLKGLAAVDALPAEGKVDQNDFLPRALIRANILRLMGRRDQARSHYEEARPILEKERNLRPGDARVHSALALVFAGLGRADEALREGQGGIISSRRRKTPLPVPPGSRTWHAPR